MGPLLPEIADHPRLACRHRNWPRLLATWKTHSRPDAATALPATHLWFPANLKGQEGLLVFAVIHQLDPYQSRTGIIDYYSTNGMRNAALFSHWYHQQLEENPSLRNMKQRVSCACLTQSCWSCPWNILKYLEMLTHILIMYSPITWEIQPFAMEHRHDSRIIHGSSSIAVLC